MLKEFFEHFGPRLQRLQPLKRLQVLAFLGILVYSVFFFAGGIGRNLDTIRQNWQPVSWFYLGLALAIFLLCFLFQAFAWSGLMRLLGGQLSIAASIRLYGLTLIPRYLPGGIWGYASRTLLLESQGISKRISLGSSVVELGLILGSGVLIALLKFLPQNQTVFLGVVFVIPLAIFLVNWLIVRATESARIRRYANWSLMAMLYFVFWILYGLSIWFVVMAVAPLSDQSPLQDIVSGSALAWLTGFLTFFVPAGLGVREVALTFVLVPIIGNPAGLIVPLMVRLVGMSAEAVFAASCLMLHGIVEGAPSSPDAYVKLANNNS